MVELMTKPPTALELGAALADLDRAAPQAAAIVRAYLETIEGADPIDRLMDYAVHPYHTRAVAAYEAHLALKVEEAAMVVRRAAAYEERTKVLRDLVLPKLVPGVISIVLAVLAHLVIQAGVAPSLIPSLSAPTTQEIP
jgi:hypothetical protein